MVIRNDPADSIRTLNTLKALQMFCTQVDLTICWSSSMLGQGQGQCDNKIVSAQYLELGIKILCLIMLL